jgi:transposase
MVILHTKDRVMTAFISPKEFIVGIDVGSLNHAVAISDEDGKILKEFEMPHTSKGFDLFFKTIEKIAHQNNAILSIAMEGYNGWARPLDGLIQQRGYKLYNVNNLKLTRFKEIFPGAAKTDRIDARKIVELFHLQKHIPVSKKVLQEIRPSDDVNARLKKITRRRKQLVEEKIAIINRFTTELQSIAPDLRKITSTVNNLWFLRFVTLKKDIRHLVKLRANTILTIERLSSKKLALIQAWQKEASFSAELDYISPMLYEDAVRILELKTKIKQLENDIAKLIPLSHIAKTIQTIPGFAAVSAGELAGEIGTLVRFQNEASLALYLGMTNLDNSSGNYRGSKLNISTSKQAKMTMITATMKHTQHVEESKRYLEKKKAEGKKYQQAIRSIERHLVRVIWSMIQQDRAYEIR